MPAVLTLPDYKERVFIVGANGSGKSFLVARLLNVMPRWVAIDLKGDFGEDLNLEGTAKVLTSVTDWRWRFFPKHYPRIIYRPRTFDQIDALIGRLFMLAIRLKKKYGPDHPYRFVLYCDEGLLQSRRLQTTWLARAAVAGRSLGLGLWVTSQRLSWIPVEVRSEQWRTYVFYLSSRDEEKEVIKLSKDRLTIPDLEALGADYSFYELKRNTGGKLTVTKFPKLSATL